MYCSNKFTGYASTQGGRGEAGCDDIIGTILLPIIVIITIIVRGRERVLRQWLCTVGKGGGDWFESES